MTEAKLPNNKTMYLKGIPYWSSFFNLPKKEGEEA
nr:MAG TPA: hypothetical protein [Caudoviricetes sp.]